MALSKRWQVKRLFREAWTDFGGPINDEVRVQRNELINRACSDVVGLFFPLFVNLYMKEKIFNTPASGKYSTSGTGTWTAATRVLVFTNKSANFAATDVGNLMLVVIGDSVNKGEYIAYVDKFTDVNTVSLRGDLPTADKTVYSFILAATTPTGDVLDISDLSIMWSEIQRSTLSSSELMFACDPLSRDDFLGFRSDDYVNLDSIVYTLSSTQIDLDSGDNITSYGTLIFRYPALPDEVESENDYIDIPDGPAINVVLLRLKILIGRRIKSQLDFSGELGNAVNQLYQSHGITIAEEANKEKVQALSQ